MALVSCAESDPIQDPGSDATTSSERDESGRVADVLDRDAPEQPDENRAEIESDAALDEADPVDGIELPDSAGEITEDQSTDEATADLGTDIGVDLGAPDVDDDIWDAGPIVPFGDYDLNDDDMPDTSLVLGACEEAPGSTCLSVTSVLFRGSEILLSETENRCDGNVQGARLRMIGDHTGDGFSEVAIGYCRADGEEAPPALAVVNPAGRTVTAQAVAPRLQDNAWIAYPSGPEGRLYPALTPSYGDGHNPLGNWGFLCLYRPDLTSDPRCGGAGFVSIVSTPTPTAFREVGGLVQDVDGDGWEDISLIFHRLIHTISPATRTVVTSSTFDVAAAERNAPAWFHSGRNYGIHAGFDAPDGQLNHLIVGGTPLGTFEDDLCNVSRFVALLTSTPDDPSSRRMAWSQYHGFSSTIFSAFDEAFADNPATVVARQADVVNNCVHRFSDSRTQMDGQNAVMINYFRMDEVVDRCLEEQYQLYLEPTWTEDKTEAWYSCFGENVGAVGVWGMKLIRESDGITLTGSMDTYIWGWTDQLLPSGDITYLMEFVPEAGRFDLSDREPSRLYVKTLHAGHWQHSGRFPVEGRPEILQVAPDGPIGAGSYTYLSELALHDVDSDGLMDVLMADGNYVGYSEEEGVFVVKPKP